MNSVGRSACAGGAIALLIAVSLLVGQAPVFGWNQPGHMLTASVAYDQLAPDQRARIAKLLEAGPDYAKWLTAAPREAADFDLGRYVFMQAARWPDDIRKTGSPYDHPVWHYVDYPVEPPAFPLDAPPADTEDIFFAAALCEKMLTDPATSPTDRAAYLSWLMHLIGDVMQPLHTATLVNATYHKPAGDKGGNAFYVSLGGNVINLHMYWDALGGSGADYPGIVVRGRALEARFPRVSLPELDAARDIRAWALEGRQLCIDVVYRRGTLPGSDQQQLTPPPLPADYGGVAHTTADRRLALAGYRLADTLRRLRL